ncbi:MAG: DUF1700 domain-containing protein [Bdellovibrionaceae bacterium]|nr:DUF1700 domain-containing protein [Pseudobdellovibrionaceae bacterium]MBX3034393.1 DUF1700 domain-containing protein [Pseudobdellovibrionaceae bacterium]
MTRTEWLIKLERELTRLGVPAPREIVADYEEHFAIAAGAGKKEEETAAKLGDPVSVARAHQAERLVSQVATPGEAPKMRDVASATWRLLVLTPFNFFMLIGPFLLLAICLFTGWMLCLTFGGVSLAILTLAATSVPLLAVNFWGTGALILAALGFVSLTVFGIMTMLLISKGALSFFVSYLKWNVDFVLAKK